MKLKLRAGIVLLMLALTAGSALAQESTATTTAPTGLTMFFLLVGVFALLGIGLFSASKDSANDGND